MNKLETFIKTYLEEGSVLQLATVLDGEPLVCTVYYVTDKKFSLYWLSYPSRQHSQAIEQNGKAAIAVAVKTDQPVIGLQAAGSAQIVTRKTEAARVMTKYVHKYGVGRNFVRRFIDKTNDHVIYRFTPKRIWLFDEVNFERDKKLELIL